MSSFTGYDITRGHAGRTPQTPLMPTVSSPGLCACVCVWVCLVGVSRPHVVAVGVEQPPQQQSSPGVCLSGVAPPPMVQQPISAVDVSSPITFPEEQDDPRVSVDAAAGGGFWGFFKVCV